MSETSIDLFAIGIERTGPRFNKKIPSYQYRKSHCGDKTILRPSYLRNGISYTGKPTSLYWIGTLVIEPPFIIHDEALSINGTEIGAKRMKLRWHLFKMIINTYNLNMCCAKECMLKAILQGHYFDISMTLIARFMGPTWGLHGADRTQVGPRWATWTLLSGSPDLCWNRDLHQAVITHAECFYPVKYIWNKILWRISQRRSFDTRN